MAKLLVVDNDAGLVHALTRQFSEQGCEVASATDGLAALETVKSEPFDVILMEYKMPGLSGLEVLAEIKRLQIKTPVVIMTASGTTETTIQAMKLGAYDYLLKPFDAEELKRIMTDALEVSRLMKEVVRLPDSLTRITSAGGGVRIIGNNRSVQEVYKLIGQVAEKDVTVLVTGESGTGKELVARAIYHHSHRAEKPFMAVNCAAIPEALLESELFGYERGAFTGADRPYAGKFERCQGGTMFFDEIGDMSPRTQAKLLRVLQEGEFERLGSTETIKANVRILAATNKNLEKEVQEGRFREDLYYRLRIISIHLPPLRVRLDDIPPLVDYFVGRFAAEYRSPVRYVSQDTLRRLQSHHWPGNVRQLENCLRRAVLMCKGDVLLPEHIQFEAEYDAAAQTPGAVPAKDIQKRLDELANDVLRGAGKRAHANLIDMVERSLIARALEQNHYNQVHAARQLGISRNTLRHRMKKYALETPSPGAPE